MSAYSKQNEKTREKFRKLGHDFYEARVTDYERRHIECDTAIRPVYDRKFGEPDAQCGCSKWRYNYGTGGMEKVDETQISS